MQEVLNARLRAQVAPTAVTLPQSHRIVDAKFKWLTQVCSDLVARVGLEPAAIFDPSEVVLTAIFPRYSITLGA
jgi:hypothetical protein